IPIKRLTLATPVKPLQNHIMPTRQKSVVLFMMAAVVLVWSGTVRGQGIGTVFKYQGRLSDGGSPANDKYDFEFKLYDALTGGEKYGNTELKEDVNVYGGYFTVELDFVDDPNVFDGERRWLQIGVRPWEESGDFTGLSPRQEVTANPYSLYAKTAGSVDGGTGIHGTGTENYIAKFTETAKIGDSSIYESGGKVGIGTTILGGKLTVQGDSDVAVWAHSSDGMGVLGSSVTENGVYGVSDTNTGVLGQSTENMGVFGRNFTSDDYGVLGLPNGGVFGLSENNKGVTGFSTNDTGVYGKNTGNGNYGHIGGIDAGVYGYSNDQLGVSGISNSGTGVYGYSISGPSVHGQSIEDIGVYGQNITSGNYGYLGTPDEGVYGESSTGLAGNFEGRVRVHRSGYVWPAVLIDNFNDSWQSGPYGEAYYGIWAGVSSDDTIDKYAVYGTALGDGGTKYGTYGDATGDGINYGVYGDATYYGDENYGVYGVAYDAPKSYGVFGRSDAPAGHGGHFVNLDTFTHSNQVGLWVGSYWNNIIEGYQLLNSDGTSFDQRFVVDCYGNMHVDGNVGIGTDTPGAKLEVSGGETILEQEGWQPPVFENSWVNLGSGFNPAGYFKDSMGVVHLRGVVKDGTINYAIFTLPSGYRPEYREVHATVTYDSSDGNAMARVDVLSNGVVVASKGNNAYVTLDGITFRAEN
ncbi:hypothetical protein ACFL02_10320, partial [Planctomycetota bacterium]